MQRLCGHLNFFEASNIHKMMCVYTTSDAHADQGKELYLKFRRDKKRCSSNKSQFILLYCVPLKEMIQKFHTQIQGFMVKV